MRSQLLNVVLAQTPADATKALGSGVQNLNTQVRSVGSSASTLGKIWATVSPYMVWILLAVGIALLAWLTIKVILPWWRRRSGAAPVDSGPPPMATNRLLQVRRGFLSGLPFANRAAVVDLPNVVVLGPAGGGKTQLIGLDVDWQRQARQFLPSYTADSLLQIYLGPDCVVQEVSAPLLEDESLGARTALRRMWSKCFSPRQKGLAAIVLDVRWLSDTPPDEQRRMAQLLRGKLNLISEACRGPVETRLCLTHMDGLEGFEDFARLLKQNGVELSFEIPKQGEEDRLASLLEGQEQYLALGLTSLPVDAFERLEHFYSQGGRSFAGLGRFVSALLEGDTLSYKPKLTRVYLSSPTPEARASGTLAVFGDEGNNTQSLRAHYLQTHLRRAAMIAAACCLPVLAAYANFYLLLDEAQNEVQRFEDTVTELREQGLEGRGEVVEQQVNEAADALLELKRAERWWPPLQTSFPDEMLDLRQRLAQGIRESHLRPALERCRKQPKDCRPEQVVYLLAALHASSSDSLGNFVSSSVQGQHTRRLLDKQTGTAGAAPATASTQARSWITALDLREPLVATYVLASDVPWERTPPCRKGVTVQGHGNEEVWSCWPYAERLTVESQLKPWADHLSFLRQRLEEGPKGVGTLNERAQEREWLKAQLADLDVYASLPSVLSLIDSSKVQIDTRHFQGIETTVQVLDWLRANRDTLAAVLNMEEEAYAGYLAVEKMGASELLTRDGLWLVGANKGPYRIELLQQSYEFRPPQLSRGLLQAQLDFYEKIGRLSVGPQGDVREGYPIMSRTPFETDLKPLVDEFTQRLKDAQLPTDEAAKRESYVQKRVNSFSRDYRAGLYASMKGYRFDKVLRWELLDRLARLTQPSSDQVDMLRDVAHRASLEPLEGPYYEPLRNNVAPFLPIVKLMTADKAGYYAALGPYHALVAQMHDELDAVSKKPADDKAAPGAGKAAAPGPADKPKEGEEEGGEGEEELAQAQGGTAELADMLTPLEKVALSMLLEEEGSYLRKAQEWLDQQGITGELRQPFLEPFLHVQRLGKQELEVTLSRQWEEATGRMLRPMLERYPFNPESKEDVDPGELEVLRRKDGAFWHHVDQVFSRVCVEKGSQWSLRGPLREKLKLPDEMLVTLSKLSRLAKLLWDEQGRPRPLMLKVQPQPLPAPPLPGIFVTMSSLKCGKTAAYGFNQSPTWQEFPLSWWDQQVSSIVLEMRSPARDVPQYLSLPWNRSAWSCFRLFEEAAITNDQRRQWSLALQGQGVSKRGLDISFGLKGEPWVPFREVPR